nr:MAG TPA: Heme exporter protein D (CcmD) [Caudoviricetes sp.]
MLAKIEQWAAIVVFAAVAAASVLWSAMTKRRADKAVADAEQKSENIKKEYEVRHEQIKEVVDVETAVDGKRDSDVIRELRDEWQRD